MRAESIAQCREVVRQARSAGKTIGLVPTMGALHAGHARLISECASRASFVVVSIFVNPAQFGPAEDFARYPRTPEADYALIAAAGGHCVFEPKVDEIYPRGVADATLVVPPASLANVHEGASRPGHFQGVATVVLKLFEIVRPDVALFGEKDYQQLLIVRRMVEDLNVNVRIEGVPTVREPDGLALSSRNRYLVGPEREAATVLHRALSAARAGVDRGDRRADRVRQVLVETIESQPLAKLDYAEIVDADTLRPIDHFSPEQPAIALVAARVGSARLIDNMRLIG